MMVGVATAACQPLPQHFLYFLPLPHGQGPSSAFPVAFRLARIDHRPDGRAVLVRNHRPVAFPTPPPRPRLGAEVTAQQEQEDPERGDADDPKNRIFYGGHSQNIGCAKSCTFKPDGKRAAARTVSVVGALLTAGRAAGAQPQPGQAGSKVGAVSLAPVAEGWSASGA